MIGIKKILNNINDIQVLIPIKKHISLDELNLLASGKISSLAQCTYTEIASFHQLTYKIQNCKSLKDCLKNLTAYSDIIEILRGFLATYIDCENQNININNLLLKPQYVFLREDKTIFICVPFEETLKDSFPEVFSKFLKAFKSSKYKNNIKLLKKVQSAEEGLLTVNRFQNVNNSSDGLVSENDTTFLAADGERMPVSSETETTVLTHNTGYITASKNYTGQSSTGGMLPAKSFNNTESETTVLTSQSAEKNGTTVLSGVSFLADNSFILRNKTSETIFINKAVFKIGKPNGEFLLDYEIWDNKKISRNHASIVFENGVHYLVDNNSTNKSYVEGAVVNAYEKIELYNGSLFSLADETFQFFIEER